MCHEQMRALRCEGASQPALRAEAPDLLYNGAMHDAALLCMLQIAGSCASAAGVWRSERPGGPEEWCSQRVHASRMPAALRRGSSPAEERPITTPVARRSAHSRGIPITSPVTESSWWPSSGPANSPVYAAP
jgi:hypothetical protein